MFGLKTLGQTFKIPNIRTVTTVLYDKETIPLFIECSGDETGLLLLTLEEEMIVLVAIWAKNKTNFL